GLVMLVIILCLGFLSILTVLIGWYKFHDWKCPLFIMPFFVFMYYSTFPLYFLMGGERNYGVSDVDVFNSLISSLVFSIGILLAALVSGRRSIAFGVRAELSYQAARIVLFFF